jgi:peptidoglycan/LPS O-acetylase OafA/YrhL
MLNIHLMQFPPHAWYLAVDWHMFVLTAVIIYPAMKIGKKFFTASLVTLIIVSTWITFKTSVEIEFDLKNL